LGFGGVCFLVWGIGSLLFGSLRRQAQSSPVGRAPGAARAGAGAPVPHDALAGPLAEAGVNPVAHSCANCGATGGNWFCLRHRVTICRECVANHDTSVCLYWPLQRALVAQMPMRETARR
jgi:hypothetical protein